MSIWRFADSLAPIPAEFQVTLGEGNTPLVRSRRIGPSLGMPHVYFKLDLCNPTGSYKDRFAVAAISHLLAEGKTRCLATSSGNTGAALAGYSAAAGLRCVIVIVETCPVGKLQQMLAYGAKLVRVRGFGPDPRVTHQTFEQLERLGQAADTSLQISAFKYSPAGMSAVQTLSFELAEQAAERSLTLDHVFTPAGGGGMTLAVARGFERLVQLGKLARSPRVECVQPEGNDTIATPLRRGEDCAREVVCTSQISGLQVPTVVDGDLALAASRASGGTGHAVSDALVWQAQRRLIREEGIFCEPAGAVALAGLLSAAQAGEIDPQATVVCAITGSGFKDPKSIETINHEAAVPTIDVGELSEAIERA